MNIFIPNILSYKGEQLTEKNLECFKNLILKAVGNNFTISYTWTKGLNYVTFNWGDTDYPKNIKVKLNEYFLFDTEDCNNFIITDEIKEEWVVIK